MFTSRAPLLLRLTLTGRQFTPRITQRFKRSLAASRPDLQPSARRKNLQDSGVPLYPHIHNQGMNVKSVAEICREYENIIVSSGGSDESLSIEKLVTIRGGFSSPPPPPTRCWRRNFVLVSIVYCNNEIEFPLTRRRQNQELPRCELETDLLRSRPGWGEDASCG